MSDDTFGWLKRKLDKAAPPESQETPSTPTIADVLTLPNPERKIVNWLVRQQSATLSDIAAYISQDEASTQSILEGLISKGYMVLVGQDGHPQYKANLRSRRSS